MTGIDGITWEMLLTAEVLFLALLMATVFFGNYYFEVRRLNPELHVFNEARTGKRPPIVLLVDPSGKIDAINAIPVKPDSIKLEDTSHGLLIDPKSIQSLPNETLSGGVRVYFYGLPFYFPTSVNGARTVIQIVNKIRKEYPEFGFIKDDFRLMELLTTSGDDLFLDVVTLQGTYPLEIPAELEKAEEYEVKLYYRKTTEELVNKIEEIKGKLKKWKIEPGYFSFHEGIKLLPLAAQSDDLTRLENNVHANDMNAFFKPPSQWMEVLKFAAICVTIMVVAYMVIKSL